MMLLLGEMFITFYQVGKSLIKSIVINDANLVLKIYNNPSSYILLFSFFFLILNFKMYSCYFSLPIIFVEVEIHSMLALSGNLQKCFSGYEIVG